MSYSNINVGKNAEDYEVSKVFDTYGRVDITLGEDEEGNVITVSYPNISDDQVGGRILTVDMPMCTDTTLATTAATRIYNSLTSSQDTAFQYQPMKAQSALLDPSAEFGDSVDINGVHSGFHTRDVDFSALMNADITSPTDEELNHEYPYQDSKQRQITRSAKEYKAGLYVNAQAISAEVSARTTQGQQLQSQLSVQATQIAARVTKTGGNNSSFGWVLNDSSHTWYSGNTEVMKVNSSGLEVKGKVTATSGKIGGFDIGSTSIYSNGMSSINSTQTTGVHVGTDGIRLGKRFKVDTYGNVTATNLTLSGGSISIGSKFTVDSSGNVSASNLTISGGSITIGSKFSVDKYGNVTATNLALSGGSISIGSNFNVDNYGNVSANNMTLTGTLTVGGNQISANNLFTGAYQASQSYGDWNSAYSSTSYGGYCYGGASDGYSAQSTWNNAQNPSVGVGWLVADSVYAKSYMQIGSYALSRSSAYVKDSNDNTVLIKFWSY